jgi:hypothetical protein
VSADQRPGSSGLYGRGGKDGALPIDPLLAWTCLRISAVPGRKHSSPVAVDSLLCVGRFAGACRAIRFAELVESVLDSVRWRGRAPARRRREAMLPRPWRDPCVCRPKGLRRYPRRYRGRAPGLNFRLLCRGAISRIRFVAAGIWLRRQRPGPSARCHRPPAAGAPRWPGAPCSSWWNFR